MAKKSDLKWKIKRQKKRINRLKNIVKVGVKSIQQQDEKIKQLSSVLESQQKPKIKQA